jgi:hypothetical protein
MAILGFGRKQNRAKQVKPRVLSDELFESLTGACVLESPTDEDRRGAPRLSVGTRATIRAAKENSEPISVLLRDFSASGVGMLIDSAMQEGDQLWVYIAKPDSPSDIVGLCASVVRCEPGGFEQSAFVVAANFIEGEAPPAPQLANEEEDHAKKDHELENTPRVRPGSALFLPSSEEPEHTEQEIADEAAKFLPEEGQEPAKAKARKAAPKAAAKEEMTWKETPIDEPGSQPAKPAASSEDAESDAPAAESAEAIHESDKLAAEIFEPANQPAPEPVVEEKIQPPAPVKPLKTAPAAQPARAPAPAPVAAPALAPVATPAPAPATKPVAAPVTKPVTAPVVVPIAAPAAVPVVAAAAPVAPPAAPLPATVAAPIAQVAAPVAVAPVAEAAEPVAADADVPAENPADDDGEVDQPVMELVDDSIAISREQLFMMSEQFKQQLSYLKRLQARMDSEDVPMEHALRQEIKKAEHALGQLYHRVKTMRESASEPPPPRHPANRAGKRGHGKGQSAYRMRPRRTSLALLN